MLMRGSDFDLRMNIRAVRSTTITENIYELETISVKIAHDAKFHKESKEMAKYREHSPIPEHLQFQ